jgi:DNA-binding NarL/FixJ family response regulator
MKIRVVLAEDFPIVRAAIASALRCDPGIQIVGEVDNGDAAVEMARELRPDVLVLDLRMPGLDGMAVLERMHRELPSVRTLVLTASEKAETLLNAVAAGAAGYLSKRTNREELRQAVIAVHGGGSVITPSLAGHLLREHTRAPNGEANGGRALLSQREQQILRLIASGHTDKEIAAELGVSPHTVQNHLRRTRDKTGLHRRSELARWAVEHQVC